MKQTLPADSSRVRLIAAAPVVFLALLFFLQLIFQESFSYAPPSLAILNSLFLPVGSVPLALLAGIGVIRTGRPQMIWLGAGVLALGTAIVLANWVGSPISADTGIKIQNLGSFIAGAIHFAGALAAFSSNAPIKSSVGRRVLVLTAAYGGAIAAIALLTLLSAAQLLPVFFVPGQGGTDLRQGILTIAMTLFAASALLSLLIHSRSRSLFMYIYGMGLALLCIGQLAYIYATSIADAMSWLGRTGQWLGAIYFAVACVTVIRQSRTERDGLQEAIESLFPSSAEGYRLLVQSSPDAIIGVDGAGRVLV